MTGTREPTHQLSGLAGSQLTNFQSFCAALSLGTFVGSILAATVLQLLTLWGLLTAFYRPWTWVLVATLVRSGDGVTVSTMFMIPLHAMNTSSRSLGDSISL